MLASLAALVLTAAPSAATPDPAPERHRVVFVQPLDTVLGLAVLGGLSLSGGASIPLNDEWSVTGDVAGLLGGGWLTSRGEDIRQTSSVALSLGLSTRLKGSGLSGFFITPKVYGVIGRHLTDFGPSGFTGASGLTQWTSGELGVMVDLALQWVHGAFFIGTVLGAGAGISVGSNSLTGSYTGPVLAFGGPGRWSPTIALNLHLLRIGYAF